MSIRACGRSIPWHERDFVWPAVAGHPVCKIDTFPLHFEDRTFRAWFERSLFVIAIAFYEDLF